MSAGVAAVLVLYGLAVLVFVAGVAIIAAAGAMRRRRDRRAARRY
jgi:Flp pilus assembly protein TadB